MKCDYCKTDPGTKSDSLVWKGFLDQDNGKRVCFTCQNVHYKNKEKTEYKGLFSELPIIVINNSNESTNSNRKL